MAFDALILRTKTALTSLFGISGSRSWWPFIHEVSAGGWQRNEPISVETSLSNSTVYACVSMISGDLSKLPLMIVERDSDGIWSEVEIPAFSPVLENPNFYQDHVDFIEWWMLSKLTQGNTYVLKARDGRNVVQAMYILDPCRVMPLESPDGSIFYQLAPDRLAGIEDSIVVPAREIIHDRMCPLFHPLVGISPLYAAGFSADHIESIKRGSNNFFKNGARPGGVLTAPGQISQATADRLKAFWETSFTGDNRGKIAVLGDDLKYTPLAQTAEQSQLVEQLRLASEDIPPVFWMPRYKVGIGPDPAYNNAGVLQEQYYSDCLQKHSTKLEHKLTRGLGLDNVPGRRLAIEFDKDDLRLMDSGARIDAGTKAIVGGMSPNEARFRFFDLGPVQGGDQPFLQKQNWPLEMLGSDQPTSTPPAPTPSAQPALPPASSESKAINGDELLGLAIKAYQRRLKAAA